MQVEGELDQDHEQRFAHRRTSLCRPAALLGSAGHTRPAVHVSRQPTGQRWPGHQPSMQVLVGQPPQATDTRVRVRARQHRRERSQLLGSGRSRFTEQLTSMCWQCNIKQACTMLSWTWWAVLVSVHIRHQGRFHDGASPVPRFVAAGLRWCAIPRTISLIVVCRFLWTLSDRLNADSYGKPFPLGRTQ
jgi:hypothetical protein